MFSSKSKINKQYGLGSSIPKKSRCELLTWHFIAGIWCRSYKCLIPDKRVIATHCLSSEEFTDFKPVRKCHVLEENNR